VSGLALAQARQQKPAAETVKAEKAEKKDAAKQAAADKKAAAEKKLLTRRCQGEEVADQESRR